MALHDPMSYSIDGRGVDTSVPVLKAGDYVLQIVESDIRPNKAQSGMNWHMKLATTQPHESNDGKEIKPNFSLFMDIALQPSENATDPEGFKRSIFAAQDGISGTDANNRELFNHEYVKSAIGKTVTATVEIDEYPKGSGQFNNKVRRLKAVK